MKGSSLARGEFDQELAEARLFLGSMSVALRIADNDLYDSEKLEQSWSVYSQCYNSLAERFSFPNVLSWPPHPLHPVQLGLMPTKPSFPATYQSLIYAAKAQVRCAIDHVVNRKNIVMY